MPLTLFLPGPADTDALGAALADAMPPSAAGALVTLQGDLGSGKTALARAFLTALGHSGPVPSPTYTLVEPYDVLEYPFYHIDLYRISSTDELEFLGWSDLRDGLILVEWPERAPDLMAQADLAIRLRYRENGREAEIHSAGELGRLWQENLQLSNLLTKPF